MNAKQVEWESKILSGQLRQGCCALLTLICFSLASACEKSPPKPSGKSATVAPWTDAQLQEQISACAARTKISDMIKATNKCDCVITQASKQWSYEAFVKDMDSKQEIVLDNESVKTCLDRVEIDSEGNTSTHAWGDAQLIEVNNEGDAYHPEVIFNSQGEAMAVWIQADATNRWHVWSKWYDGQFWRTNQKIAEAPTGETAREPHIAFDANGDVHAVWYTTTSEAASDGAAVARVWWSHFTDSSNQWSTPLALSETPSRVSIYPQISFNSKGAGIVAWYTGIWVDHGFLTDYVVQAKTFDPASGQWSPLTQFMGNLLPLANNRTLSVAYSDSGDAFVSWIEGVSDTNTQVAMSHFKEGTGWDASPYTLSNTTQGFNLRPIVAVDSNGEAIIAWFYLSGDRTLSIAQGSVWKNGALTGPTQLSGNSDGQVDYLDAVFDQAGHAIVVWGMHKSTVENPLGVNYYNASSGWGQPEKLNDGNPNRPSTYPTLSSDGSGRAMVIWAEFDGTRHNIKARHWENNVWGTTELLEKDDSNEAFAPSVSLSPKGGAIAVWLQVDGNNRKNVWSNFFE